MQSTRYKLRVVRFQPVLIHLCTVNDNTNIYGFCRFYFPKIQSLYVKSNFRAQPMVTAAEGMQESPPPKGISKCLRCQYRR